MFLGDFHVHSTFSDGKLTIPQIVDLYGKHGFGVVAITDHLCEERTVLGKAATYLGCTLTPATFPLYMEILRSEAERAWRLYKMVVIPGVELTKNTLSNHRSAHIVGLGISNYISADAPILSLARSVREQGGVAIAAHPVWTRRLERQTYYLWDNREMLRKEFDAWEVASGPHIFDEVAKTDLPKIASSDLHLERHLTSWKTLFQCERHPEAVLEAIRKQEIDFRFFTAQTKVIRELSNVAAHSAVTPVMGIWAKRRTARDGIRTQTLR